MTAVALIAGAAVLSALAGTFLLSFLVRRAFKDFF